MSVEADIVAALQPLFAGRVYPDYAPNNAAKPFCVYQQVGGTALAFFENAVPSMTNGRIQIAVWGDRRADVAALGLAVEQAMVIATAFQARPIGAAIAESDEQTRLRGSRQDFSVWSQR